MYGVMQVRVGYSPALICAGVLLASGERAEGLRLLDGLDGMLARLEKNGWGDTGLDSLRAQSLALRGQPDAAVRSLRRAVARGWRSAWTAQTEPYLSSLWEREDFKSLMKEVEARNAEMRARFLQINSPTPPSDLITPPDDKPLRRWPATPASASTGVPDCLQLTVRYGCCGCGVRRTNSPQ